jgi:polar amino acid transport system substrate-binding protein
MIMQRLALLVIVAAGLSVSTFAEAEPAKRSSEQSPLVRSTLRSVLQRKTLRVGMYPGVVPFAASGADADELRRLTHDETGPRRATDGRVVAGFDVALAAAAAAALGVTLEVVLVDRFDDLLPGLAAGRYDVVISGVTRTLARATTVAFSEPYFSSGLLVLARDTSRFPTLASLNAAHARVALRGGTTAQIFAKAMLAGTAVRALSGDAELFAAMDDPAVDAVVIDYVSARDAEVRGRVRAHLDAIEDRRFTVEHFAFAAPLGDPDWIGWLNLMLREAKASGDFHRLAARYNAWFRSER